ncbi:MAG: membrane protein insertase YidC [Bacteroidota bacterium]
MDKNQVTGLILVSLILLIYIQFFAPSPEELQNTPVEEVQNIRNQDLKDSSPDNKNTIEAVEELPDSVVDKRLKDQFGIFHMAVSDEEALYKIENSEVEILLSSKGGFVQEVTLKDFRTYDDQPLVLIDEASADFSFFITSSGKKIDLSDISFKPANYNSPDAENDTINFDLIADLEQGKKIVQHYSIPPNGYVIGYELEFIGLQEFIDQENFEINWKNDLKKFESSIETSRINASINYYTAEGDFDNLSESSLDLEEETITEKINWATFKQRFFSTGIIAKNNFDAAYFRTNVNEGDSNVIKSTQMVLSIPNTGNNDYEFALYFGPNNYQILKKVTEGFSRNVYLGWKLFSWFNKYLIIPVFNFLDTYISNYGIIILILVIVIKLLLFPLSYSSYMSFAKQRVLKPEIDKLKEEHGDDMQKMQQAQMKLFQQVGINPISGCIPIVLQMPILLAMFNFFPNSVELRQEGFLWAHDLSTYDSILDLPFTIPFYGNHVSLFTILMTVSTILTQKFNNQMSSSAMQGPMKTMMYIMPVMFMFVLNSFSAGLTYYYFVANLITIGQQFIIRGFVDEEKIRAVLEENKKKNKNKKKSKWQMRVEEAMKASQEAKSKPKGKK